MDFWDRVNQALNQKDISLNRLAGLMRVKHSDLHRAMSRKQDPSIYQALAIAEVLELSVEYLVTGKDPTGWRPPKRISKVVDNLILLDEHSLLAVETLAEGLALKSKSINVASGGG